MKLPLKVTGDHSIVPPAASQSGYEDYHVVDADNRCIVELAPKTRAYRIVKCVNNHDKLAEALSNLLKAMESEHDELIVLADDDAVLKARAVLKEVE